MTLAVCYRPPDDNAALATVAASLTSMSPDTPIIAVGDFNLPEVEWRATDDGVIPLSRRATARATRFVDDCGVIGLKQWVTVPSRGPNTLDLLFSRFVPCTSVRVTDGLFDSDHKEMCGEFRVPKVQQTVSRRTAYNYKDADFTGLRRALSMVNWGLLDDMDVDCAVDMFYELLESAINDYIPTVTVRRRCPPWYDREVKAVLRQKEAAFRRMRRNPGDESTAEFAQKRKTFKSLVSQKCYQYLAKLADDLKTNPKRYWSFVKSLRKSSSISNLIYRNDGSLTSDDREKVEIFNKTFASKFTRPDAGAAAPQAVSYPLDALSQLHVSESSIRSALSSLAPNKACGPDNISARIIIECREELVVPLTKICRLSVSYGVFPAKWKSANIIPIFKKGDKKAAGNYRSVSLLPLFGKILERAVYDQLFRHTAPVLCKEQHGFVPGRSCTSNLAVFLTRAWEAISEGYQTDTVYTDFSAAFQSVNHAYLIHKLEHSYHLRGSALAWFASYLSDRRQRVTLNGKASRWTSVLSGTPEGSLLAPILFSLFINDLPAELYSECLLYADDAKIFRKIITPIDAMTLQQDLDRLHVWSDRWGLSLNPAKCKALSVTLRRAPVQTTYQINGVPLENVSEMRDLGVIIDSKLTFSAHISRAICQANKALGVMMRSFQSGARRARYNDRTLLATYFAVVRSILEYGCVVWAGAAKSHTERVDRVQHRFLMWLNNHTNSPCHSLSYHDLLNHFKITTLSARRVQYDLLFLRHVFSGKIDSADLLENFPLHVPPRSTRSQRLFAELPWRVKTVGEGFLRRIPKETNSFLSRTGVDFFNDSVYSFRKCVLEYVRTF